MIPAFDVCRESRNPAACVYLPYLILANSDGSYPWQIILLFLFVIALLRMTLLEFGLMKDSSQV